MESNRLTGRLRIYKIVRSSQDERNVMINETFGGTDFKGCGSKGRECA